MQEEVSMLSTFVTSNNCMKILDDEIGTWRKQQHSVIARTYDVSIFKAVKYKNKDPTSFFRVLVVATG